MFYFPPASFPNSVLYQTNICNKNHSQIGRKIFIIFEPIFIFMYEETGRFFQTQKVQSLLLSKRLCTYFVFYQFHFQELIILFIVYCLLMMIAYHTRPPKSTEPFSIFCIE